MQAGFFAGRTLDVNGTKRKYDLFVPAGHDPNVALPLVMVFHADVATSLRPELPIESVSAGKAIIAYPYGLGPWDLSASSENYDFDFITDLRTSLGNELCVDEDRVFGVGYSNGGFFLNMLACRRGTSMFRAIAVNSGGLFAPDGEDAEYDPNGNLICPAPPVGALVIHGTDDFQVNYTDNGVYARDSWLAANECDDSTTALEPSPCVTYSSCKHQPVGFCSLPGGGHELWSKTATASWHFFSSF